MNNKFGPSVGGGSCGLSDASINFINNIPAISYPYIASMNQHVATNNTVDFAKIILGNGSNVAPSLGFSSSAGLYLGSSNTPTFNTQISSNGYKITSDTLPTILGYGISSTLQSGDTIIGQSAGSVMTGNNNTAVGVKALNLATTGDSNTACGWLALGRLINDGYNTACGALALQNLTGGVSNIGLGYNSGISVKTGISSIFIGAYSGLLTGTDCDDGVCIGGSSKIVSNSIAIGFEAAASTSCVALGYRALKTGTNIGNTAIGNLALTLNTTGYYNTGIGYSAFGSLVDGFQNTGVGSNVFPALTTGQDNSAVGDSSGGTIQTGRCNSFLGKSSQSTGIDTQYGLCLGYNTQTDSYGIALGANAIAPANGCVIGTADIFTTRIYGRVGINQAPDASAQFAVSGDTIHYGKTVVNSSVDGGSSRGIFLWDINDDKWGIYMSAAGAGRSLSNGIACASGGAANITGHMIRIRCFHVGNNGLVIENSAEQPLLSIRGSDGYTYIAGGLEVAGKVGVSKNINIGGTASVFDNTVLRSSFSRKGLSTRALGRIIQVDPSPVLGLPSIAYSPELGRIVITTNGSNFYTSEDGISWTTRSVPFTRINRDVCWSPELGIFVAVHSSGTADGLISSDGITWTPITTASVNQWISVCWAPELGIFCAVSNNGTSDRVMTSSNGTVWEPQLTPNKIYQHVCWSPELSLFVAVADDSSNTVMTSTNGIHWVERTTPSRDFVGVCWSPELMLFCAVESVLSASNIWTSPNGIDWTQRTKGTTRQLASVNWAPELGVFVACSLVSGATDAVYYSSDGITWNTSTTPTTVNHQLREGMWVGKLGLHIMCCSSNGNINGVFTSKYVGVRTAV